VRDACLAVRPELVQSVRSLGAGRLDLLRHVYFPASLPSILTALRVSTGTAVAVLFLAETFATQAGLAYFITVEAWGRLAYADMYAGVLAMAMLGLSTYMLLDRLERRACEWMVAR
jgi:ABC-type nitrate/sulfonate/bicarbonate transport system permease component